MVLRANKESSELGGHIASFQSSATMYDTGFNHFWHAPSQDHGGDLIYFQGHISPGIYARSFLEGRLSEAQLDGFRQEVDERRAVVVPAPVADARLLAVPDGVDGPGAADGDLPGPLPQVPGLARAGRHRRPEGLGLPGGRRDRRAGVAGGDLARRPGAAGQPDLRGQLQPAAPGRPGPGQRQDHPGAGGHLPRGRLERHQGHLGQRLGRAAGQGHHRAAAAADGGVRRRPVPGLQVQERGLCPRALLRRLPRAARAGRRHERRGDLEPQPRRPRPGQGVRRLRGGGRATPASRR